MINVKIFLSNSKKDETLYVFDFDDTIKSSENDKELPSAKILKKLLKNGSNAIILTANPNTTKIKKYLKDHDMDVKVVSSFGVEKQKDVETHTAKKQILKQILKDQDYKVLYFYDDQEDNLKSAVELGKELKIKVIAKLPPTKA